MNIAILVLAAGSSKRMGLPKQLLSIEKKTLLEIVIENAKSSNAHTVLCVLGSPNSDIVTVVRNCGINYISNPHFQKGLSSSIAMGIEFLSQKDLDAVLITLGDQPLVDALSLNKLIKSFELNPKKISATSYVNNKGVPAIFPKKYFKNLTELEGDSGAKNLLNTEDVESIEINKDKLIDIDTKQDYVDFLNSLSNTE